jgi:KEOPS complex subunit Pcc1
VTDARDPGAAAPAPAAPDGDAFAHETTLSFEYADRRRARVVADAVAVEVDEIADDRSRATVGRAGRLVAVRVGAADLVALRAGTNTWVRLVATAERVADAAEA